MTAFLKYILSHFIRKYTKFYVMSIPYSENILLTIYADCITILTLYKDFSETSKLL